MNKRPSQRTALRFLSLLCLLALTACHQNNAPASSFHELTGDSTQRVAALSALLKCQPTPTPMLDAQFQEQQVGDNNLGPADFVDFYYIEVAPTNIVKWTQALIPLSEPAAYVGPAPSRDWWIDTKNFETLTFYKAEPLTGKPNGWIGISPQTGRIYIFAYSM